MGVQRRLSPRAARPATTPRSRRSTASRAAAATSGSTAVCETCWARSATDFMVRTKSPGASSPTSRAATPRAVEKEAPRAQEATAVARPGAGWRVRGTRCASSMARMRSARTVTASQRRASSTVRLSPRRSCSWPGACPVRGRPIPAVAVAVAVAREAPGPAGLEDDRREHAGQHGGLGPGQDVAAQGLGDQEIGLVVDPATGGARPASGSSRRRSPARSRTATRWPSWRRAGRACGPATGRRSAAAPRWPSPGRTATTRLTARL